MDLRNAAFETEPDAALTAVSAAGIISSLLGSGEVGAFEKHLPGST
jgi:hypothetical protein